MISVIILTYNEEKNIERCLKSIADLTDDIVIVDSFSTDTTLDICRKYNCRIYQNPFINQAIQFNWALDNIDIKHEWILRLDSDEIIPDKLKMEIKQRVGNENEIVGYYLNRRMYWMNRWLRHGRVYPHYILRLFKKGYGRYEEKTEEHLVMNAKTSYMKNDFLEDNRLNNVKYFTLKHLSLADGEIKDTLLQTKSENDLKASLFGPKATRTRWLKENIYVRLPLFIRGFLYFFYRYIVCLGFLDGIPGLTYHILQGFWYRFYIDATIYEQRSNWQDIQRNYSNI